MRSQIRVSLSLLFLAFQGGLAQPADVAAQKYGQDGKVSRPMNTFTAARSTTYPTTIPPRWQRSPTVCNVFPTTQS